MVTGIPESENCAPLVGRSQDFKFVTIDGHPAIEVMCDCATVTQHVWPADLIAADAGLEVPLTCDGCGTTAWMTIRSTAEPSP